MNKKRLFGAFLIITALVIMLLPAAEADAETSASAFTINSGKITTYKGTDSIVSVPQGILVIGEGAFEDNDYVEKIVLPDSVKKIEAYAFWGCDNLKTVVLGDGLTMIDDLAFTNCDGLETMTLPSNIRSIGIQAFADCNSLEDITIPPQVTNISEDAFDGDYLLNIHCETGSYADKYAQAFYERQKDMAVYVDEDVKDNKVEVPEDGVYSGADASQKDEETEGNGDFTELPGEVLGSTKVVDNQAVVFMQNAELPVQNAGEHKSDVADTDISDKDNVPSTEILDGVVCERTHYRDEKMKEAVLDEKVKKIDRFAYARSALKKLTMPQGLETIEYAAFYHCDDLMEVVIPDSVTSVAAKAFGHTAWVENFLAGEGEDDFLISGGVLIAYRGDSASVTIPNGVRVIAGDAFEDHTEIEEVILPASVTNIDVDAFDGCSPKKVEYSGESMDEELVEELVSLNSLSAAPNQAAKNFLFTKIFAVILLVCGSIFIVQKSR